jgi:hypothetical protein
LIAATVNVVPREVPPNGTARVRIELFPIVARKAHWNNEAEPMVLWVEPPSGWSVERQLWRLTQPAEPVSNEARVIEVELGAPADARAGLSRGSVYAVYYVCEDLRGTCALRRKDISFAVRLVER